MCAGRAWTLLAAALGYSAVAVAGSPWTLYSAVFTAIPGIVLLGYALRRGWHRRRVDRPPVRLGRIGRRGLAVAPWPHSSKACERHGLYVATHTPLRFLGGFSFGYHICT